MSNGNGHVTVPEKMLKVLQDGMRHSKHELHGCLDDELAPITAIQSHVSALRKRLRPVGEDIICELFERRIYYRHVRLLGSANDGRT